MAKYFVVIDDAGATQDDVELELGPIYTPTPPTPTPDDGQIYVGDILRFFRQQYAFIPVQTYDQYQVSQGTEPTYLSYDFFSDYCELAASEFNADLLKRGGITASNVQAKAAITHIVADYCEMSNPDWSFPVQSINLGEGLPRINITRGEDTAPRMAYNKLMDIIELAARHAPTPFNGASPDPIFYRDMMTYKGGTLNSISGDATAMKNHDDW